MPPRHLFVDFQMRVREMAETAAVVPPPPPLPAELRAALLEAPQGRERQREREVCVCVSETFDRLAANTARLGGSAEIGRYSRD